MRTLRWTIGLAVGVCLGCALGPDEPVALEEVPEETHAEQGGEEEAATQSPAKQRPRPGTRLLGPQASREGTSPDGTASDAPPPAAEAPAADTPSKSTSAPPAGITALGSGRWSVQRSLVRKWEEQPRKFAKVNEKGKGWALKGVDTRDARHLGFQNGDVVLTVNGHPLETQAQAVAAYGQVRKKDQLVVRFKRDGAQRTHTIDIVD